MATARNAKQAKRYHHGALREGLVKAGLEILEERGVEGLSLRACAERLGVSHAAPAHHFKSFKALTSALAAVGFRELGADLATARQDELDPLAAVRAAFTAYLLFVGRHPELFRLMFSAPRVDAEDDDLRAAAVAAYGELAALAKPYHAKLGGRFSMTELQVEQMIWSTIHGYAELYVGNQIACSPDELGALAVEAGKFAEILEAAADGE